jgi:hypothetical protein
VIDDPIRSRENADSQTVRDKIWDWYKFDLVTRLRPGGWVSLIHAIDCDESSETALLAPRGTQADLTTDKLRPKSSPCEKAA